jgi:hypothetical protein
MTKTDLTHLVVSLDLQDDSDGSSDGDFSGSFVDEFFALAKARKWKVGSKDWRGNWEIHTQLENERLAQNPAARLESWQQLCVKLGLEAPPSITKSRKVGHSCILLANAKEWLTFSCQALSGVYVNIVDVLECWTTGKCPKKFGNAKQLAAYTNRKGKFFNRNLAKKSKMLGVLLKQIV